VLPQGSLKVAAVGVRSVFWGKHGNGSRANGLRVERVGVRHVDVQVGEHQLEFPMSFVERAAPKVHRLTKNGKGQKKNEIVMDHRWLQRPWTEQYGNGPNASRIVLREK
jgi:hypothetical protein